MWHKKDKLVGLVVPEGGTDRPDQTSVYGDASADDWDCTADQQVASSPMSEPSLDPPGADEEDIPAFPYDADEEEGDIEKEVIEVDYVRC